MPIALDPNQTFDVVLKSDQGKDAKIRPTFEFRHLTSRQLRQAMQFGDDRDALEEMTFDEIANKLETILTEHLAGWRYMPPAPEHDPSVGDLCTMDEMWELYYAMRSGASLKVESKKNSATPSPDSGDRSAEMTVAETPDDVGIAPVTENR